MFKVKTLKEAKYWFSNHNSGSLICVNNKNEKECNNLDEANIFYDSKLMSPYKFNQITNYLQSLEKAIENVEKAINRIKGLSQINAIDLNDEIMKTIANYEEYLIKYKEIIKNTIKNNPELEPFWIMHQITK